MAKALYDYWFVQFDFPDETGKPYKSSGGRMVWNKILKREIPLGWEVDNILSIAELIGGGTPSKKISEYWNGDIPFFTPTDTNGFLFSINTQDNISNMGLKESSTKLFSKGSVFITARGSVGNLMIAGKPMAMNQSCYAFVSKAESEFPYLYYMCLSMVGLLKAKSSGSVFNSIVSNDIKLAHIPIAEPHLRNRFSLAVMPVFNKVLANQVENQQLSALRDWLLPMLMNGQVKVH